MMCLLHELMADVTVIVHYTYTDAYTYCVNTGTTKEPLFFQVQLWLLHKNTLSSSWSRFVLLLFLPPKVLYTQQPSSETPRHVFQGSLFNFLPYYILVRNSSLHAVAYVYIRYTEICPLTPVYMHSL